jgi:hypothetical protein
VDKRVVAVLRNGSRVESEPMVGEDARREITRIHEEAQAGRTNKFVKLGNNAIFNLEDLDRIAVEDASVDE